MAGLRERKKEETRLRITVAARRLFFENGFDAVTVANVAREADVSEATVFNYFRTKEELFFSGLDAFETRLVEAVRDRSAGESVLAAFQRLVLDGAGTLADRGAGKRIARAAEVIGSSAALQDQERIVRARHADALAAVIAAEVAEPDRDVEVAAVATALMAVHGSVVEHTRLLAARGITGKKLAEAVKRQAAAAFDRLAEGLRHYAVR